MLRSKYYVLNCIKYIKPFIGRQHNQINDLFYDYTTQTRLCDIVQHEKAKSIINCARFFTLGISKYILMANEYKQNLFDNH